MTITIASSKSIINHECPSHTCSCLDLTWSCKKLIIFFPHVVVFSVTIIIESMLCTAKTENNTNANILEAELFFQLHFISADAEKTTFATF